MLPSLDIEKDRLLDLIDWDNVEMTLRMVQRENRAQADDLISTFLEDLIQCAAEVGLGQEPAYPAIIHFVTDHQPSVLTLRKGNAEVRFIRAQDQQGIRLLEIDFFSCH